MDAGAAESEATGSNNREIVQKGNFACKKRSTQKFPARENDVFVSNKTTFQAQLKRCEKLFQSGLQEIFIHALGAAISTAINVALTLQEKSSNTFDITANTSTVDLMDDFFPLTDDERPFSEMRSNSAIHIRVRRKFTV